MGQRNGFGRSAFGVILIYVVITNVVVIRMASLSQAEPPRGSSASEGASGAASQPESAQESSPESPAADTSERWLLLLGHESFWERDAAAQELARQGLAALPILEAGVEHADPEVRGQCRRLLARLGIRSGHGEMLRRLGQWKKDAATELPKLLEAAEGVSGSACPGWEIFRAYAGEDRDARQLYVRLVRAEPELLVRLDLGQDLSREIQSRFDRLMGIQTQPFDSPAAANPALEDIAAFLLLGCATRPRLEPDGLLHFLFLLQDGRLEAPLRGWDVNGARLRTREPVTASRRLLLAFLKRRHNELDNTGPLYRAAVAWEFPEFLDAARKTALDRARSAEERAYALGVIGKFGTASQIAEIAPLLQEETVVMDELDKEDEQIVDCRIRDVALVMTLIHRGESPWRYGMRRMNRTSCLLDPILIGYSPRGRAVAFEQWRLAAGDEVTAPSWRPVVDPVKE